MNFKEQMQKKAEQYFEDIPDDVKAGAIQSFQEIYQAALTSDLVKGLVNALEFANDHIYLLDGSEESHAVVDKIQTALTNYKQEVKH